MRKNSLITCSSPSLLRCISPRCNHTIVQRGKHMSFSELVVAPALCLPFILSSSVHLTDHVHICDCLSLHPAVSVLACLSEHFIILFSVRVCSSTRFVSLLLCFAFFIFSFFFFFFLNAGQSPCFCSTALPPLSYLCIIFSISPAVPFSSSPPALPSADHALIILQREALPRQTILLPGCSPLCPLSIKTFSTHSRSICQPPSEYSFHFFNLTSQLSFIAFFPHQYIHKTISSSFGSVRPFTQLTTLLLFLLTSPHPAAVRSKCRETEHEPR